MTRISGAFAAELSSIPDELLMLAGAWLRAWLGRGGLQHHRRDPQVWTIATENTGTQGTVSGDTSWDGETHNSPIAMTSWACNFVPPVTPTPLASMPVGPILCSTHGKATLSFMPTNMSPVSLASRLSLKATDGPVLFDLPEPFPWDGTRTTTVRHPVLPSWNGPIRRHPELCIQQRCDRDRGWTQVC